MIDKREILDAATGVGLTPHVVEKDYVLGWLLWGIANHDAIASSWAFKGGTCLKKCFFETYRFSEDLDFTLADATHLDEGFLKTVFADIAAAVYDRTGIEVPADAQRFNLYRNRRGKVSCQARIAYRGPVSPRGSNMPRIKLDLTADELLVLPVVSLRVFHPYSDEPPEGITIGSYAFEEAFAEKVRALAERARPRDLYDVVNLFRLFDERPKAAVLANVLRQKCAFKGIELPVVSRLEPSRPVLEASWAQMLEHQLPMLPPFETFWNDLPAFFGWLAGGYAPPRPTARIGSADEDVIRDRIVSFPAAVPAGAWPTMQAHLDVIRFAAANRLCVDLRYLGSTRRIEPYSLRRTLEGNVILHAHNRNKNAHRSYRLDRIQGAQVTNESFVPRFVIELTPSGRVSAPPTARKGHGLSDLRSRRPARRSRGPRHVYQCGYCGKRFYRKTRTNRLNKHKDKAGYPCPGRSAYYIETRH